MPLNQAHSLLSPLFSHIMHLSDIFHKGLSDLVIRNGIITEHEHADFLVFISDDEDGSGAIAGTATPSEASTPIHSPYQTTQMMPLQLPIHSIHPKSLVLPPIVIDPAGLKLIPPIAGNPPGGPHIWMTCIEGVYVFITWLSASSAAPIAAGTGQSAANSPMSASFTSFSSTPPQRSYTPPLPTTPPTPLLRRVDNGMVNATLLLHAGGLETDRERSIVLSLERHRARCRRVGSRLRGTWVPWVRAKEMARTVCLGERVGLFLEDDLGCNAFGLARGFVNPKRRKGGVGVTTGVVGLGDSASTPSTVAVLSKGTDPDANVRGDPLSALVAASQTVSQTRTSENCNSSASIGSNSDADGGSSAGGIVGGEEAGSLSGSDASVKSSASGLASGM